MSLDVSRRRGRTVVHEEHLDAKDADGALAERVDRPHGVLLRALVDALALDGPLAALLVPDPARRRRRRAQRRVHDVAHAVAVDRLDGRVRARVAARAAHDHDGDLLGKGRELFGVQAVGERAGARGREGRGGDEGVERGAHGGRVARAQDIVAAAVVGEVARLEEERVAELGAGGRDGGNEGGERVGRRDGRVRVGGDGEEGRDGDAALGEVHLLEVLVLDRADDARRGEDLDALARAAAGRRELVGDLLEGVDVDVLDLDREDVGLAGELADLCRVGEGAVDVGEGRARRGKGGQDLGLRHLLGRGGDVWVEGDDGDGHGACGLEEHAAELTAACIGATMAPRVKRAGREGWGGGERSARWSLVPRGCCVALCHCKSEHVPPS